MKRICGIYFFLAGIFSSASAVFAGPLRDPVDTFLSSTFNEMKPMAVGVSPGQWIIAGPHLVNATSLSPSVRSAVLSRLRSPVVRLASGESFDLSGAQLTVELRRGHGALRFSVGKINEPADLVFDFPMLHIVPIHGGTAEVYVEHLILELDPDFFELDAATGFLSFVGYLGLDLTALPPDMALGVLQTLKDGERQRGGPVNFSRARIQFRVPPGPDIDAFMENLEVAWASSWRPSSGIVVPLIDNYPCVRALL